METEHKALLRNILEGGSIPISNTIESHRLLGELVDAGLVEIVEASGTTPAGYQTRSEYRLTRKGKEIAASIQGD